MRDKTKSILAAGAVVVLMVLLALVSGPGCALIGGVVDDLRHQPICEPGGQACWLYCDPAGMSKPCSGRDSGQWIWISPYLEPPSTEPTALPTELPPSTTTSTLAPTLSPTPAGSACPMELPEGAEIRLVTGVYATGADGTPRSLHATVRVRGSLEYCAALGHQAASNDCHLEGYPRRVECEMELLRGCPVWQYQDESGGVGPCVDDQAAPLSCDHFGSPDEDGRDDPKTPTTGDTLETLLGFEGRPLVCGLQRDAHGPEAGFFAVPHGRGLVRACPPAGPSAACGSWIAVDH